MTTVGGTGAPGAQPGRVQLLSVTCVRGTFDIVFLPQVVGIPQPSNFVLRSPGAQEVFLTGITPELAANIRGREVTACGFLARFFGSGPFAQQSVLGLIPFFLV